jgi:hypothetical protein
VKSVWVREIPVQDVADLGKDDAFLVHENGTKPGDMVLVWAALGTPVGHSAQEVLRAGIPPMRAVPTLQVDTVYGSRKFSPANRLYEEVEAGTPNAVSALVMETVGTQVGIVVYAPGGDGPETLRRIRKALRSEFGIGGLQLRQESHRPVGESGLPPVLGVPRDALPKLI